jgi:hypothetical protein
MMTEYGNGTGEMGRYCDAVEVVNMESIGEEKRSIMGYIVEEMHR